MGTPEPPLDPSHDALVDRYVDAYNAFDVDAMVALLTDDVVFEHHVDGEAALTLTGRDAFRSLATQSAALFAERRQRIVGRRPTPDGIEIDVEFTARLASPPDGTPSQVRLTGSSEFTFRDAAIRTIVDRS